MKNIYYDEKRNKIEVSPYQNHNQICYVSSYLLKINETSSLLIPLESFLLNLNKAPSNQPYRVKLQKHILLGKLSLYY